MAMPGVHGNGEAGVGLANEPQPCLQCRAWRDWTRVPGVSFQRDRWGLSKRSGGGGPLRGSVPAQVRGPLRGSDSVPAQVDAGAARLWLLKKEQCGGRRLSLLARSPPL